MTANIDNTLINAAYEKMAEDSNCPVDDREEHLAALKKVTENCISEMNSPEEIQDQKFSVQITPVLTVLVIGAISSVVLGLTGGIPLLIASAITTVTLVHILLAKIAYNAYQQDQRDIPK